MAAVTVVKGDLDAKLGMIAELTDKRADWEWAPDPENKGIFLRNNEFSTKVHVTWQALSDNTLETVKAACVQGKNVDHITRVTGYFSTVSNWNKGKLAELKDRARVGQHFTECASCGGEDAF